MSPGTLAATGAQPAFLTTVCHCLAQAVRGHRSTPYTARSKQWHTVAERAYPPATGIRNCPPPGGNR
jgi:hypothetical protein